MKTIAVAFLLLVSSVAAFASPALTLGRSGPADVVKKFGPAIEYEGKPVTETKHDRAGGGWVIAGYDNGVLKEIRVYGPIEKSEVQKTLAANAPLRFSRPFVETYYRDKFDSTTGQHEKQKRTKVEYVSKDGTQILRYTVNDQTKKIGYLYLGPISGFKKD